MKNIFILLFYCLLNTLPLLAQTNCQSILTNARNAAAKDNYKEAIDKYTSAVDCDPNLSTTANNEIKAMFDKINKLKDDAIKAKNEIVKQKQIAQTQAEASRPDRSREWSGRQSFIVRSTHQAAQFHALAHSRAGNRIAAPEARIIRKEKEI